MRKIISMLLAFSMSLSVMCSSFTVAAVDGNDTAAQTDNSVAENTEQINTGVGGLFSNNINEKIAARSNECGISTVEMNGNTATVDYWSNRDCTVIVGIYADDGTKGTHMVTFGTAQVKAAETEASVTIDNIPQYFYLKAFLVDSESYRPLSVAYENSNYTEDMKEFFEYSIYDFDPEDVWNFDDNPDNNFMVLTDDVVTVNMELSISSSDIEMTANRIKVNNLNLDQNGAKLKKGTPFMFWSDAETMTYGTVTNIITNGNETVIEYSEAQVGDLFEYIRIETENVVDDDQSAYAEEKQLFSDYTENTRVLTASTENEHIYTDYVEELEVFNSNADNKSELSSLTVSPDYSDYKKATIEKLETSFSPIRFELKATTNDGKDDGNKSPFEASVTGSGEIQFNTKADATLYFKKDLKDIICEVIVTPKVTITLKGTGAVSYTNKAPLDLKIATFMVGPVEVGNIKAELSAGCSLTVSAEGTITFSTKYTAAADLNKSEHDDILTFKSEPQQPDISGKVSVTFNMPIKLSVSANLLETKWGPAAKVSAAVSLTGTVGAALKSDNLVGNKKHICDFCVDGTISIKLSGEITFESPALKFFNIGNKDGKLTLTLTKIPVGGVWMDLPVELVPEGFRKFHINNSEGLVWGKSCDNYAYRTYFDVEDELTGDKLENIFVYTEDASGTKYSEDTTNRGGRAVLYLKPNESFKIGFRDTKYTYNNEDKYFTVTEPDEKFTVKMTVGVPPTYIEPRPAETEEVPTFFLGEKLRYNKLMVKYDERTYYIDFTDDMIESFDPNTLGEQTLVIEYNGKSWSHKIKIIEDNRELQSVFLSPVPTKKEYKTGESLDLGNAKLNAVYKNVNTGETETDKNIEITSDMVSGFDTSTEGEKEVTVTFTDAKGRTASTSFNITVVDDKREVESIKINTPPNKTEYKVGESLDITGLTIDVYFTDGTSDTGVSVSSSNVTGFDSEIAGTKSLTVTYTDKYGNEAAATFAVEVVNDGDVESIRVLQLLDKNKYCEINKELNLDGAIIEVTHKDGTTEILAVTSDMVKDFDSSTLGTFPVTVTYEHCQTSYSVKVVDNLKKVCRIVFESFPCNFLQGNVDNGNDLAGGYKIREYFLDGTTDVPDNSIHVPDGYYESTIIYNDRYGGKIKIENFDINKIGIQEVKAYYCFADGTIDTSVESASTWVSVQPGSSNNHVTGNKINLWTKPDDGGALQSFECFIGGGSQFDKFYVTYSEWGLKEDGEYGWVYNGAYISIDGHNVLNPSKRLTNYKYLGGFDSSYPTERWGSRRALFDIDGYILSLSYVVKPYELTSSAIANYDDFSDYPPYNENDLIYKPEFIETEAPVVTETPDNTDETNSTESIETEVTEPVDTDTEVTEPTVTEPIVTEPTVTEPEVTETQVETSTVEEAPVLAIDNNGVFGFGRAGRKTAQYANLHKNDIYNYYVVKSAAADILSKDNLLFVGQTSSDGNGSLSFEYETTTGEDGEIILRPMSDDPTTPDKPSTPDNPNNPTTPNAPGNGGSSSNTAVIPVNGTVTKTMTIKVENKVTGETSKARGQKTGSSVTVKLGTENDGCYANVYTTDDEYICSAIIENGRAKFNVSNDVKLKIVIDSIAYGEDVSSGAGAFGDSVTESLPYAVITIVIAIVGIYFKRRSEKKVK